MKIKTLTSVPRVDVFEAFKKSFKNYVLPLDIKKETTFSRWESSSVNFDLSYGAFDGEELVAFILHASYGKTLYNFTTGVIPTHRGQHLIELISDEIKRKIKGHDTYTLEVIRENFKAIKLYEKLGFKKKRELVSVKGKLNITRSLGKASYDVLPLSYSSELASLTLAQPALENSKECLEKYSHYHELHVLRNAQKILAYAIYTPLTMSLREIGGRDPEELDQLFLHMKLNGEVLRVMNIDSSSSLLLQYFEERGVDAFVTQFEMSKAF